MPEFKIYRSNNSLLILGISEHGIDLPYEDALRLANAIQATLVAVRGPNYKWTPERVAELTRLYVAEKQSAAHCAAAFGITTPAVEAAIIKHSLVRKPRAALRVA